MDLQLTLNGKRVVWQAEPGENALDLLRRHSLSSVKWGCGEGDCGACTILLDGRSVRSCLLVAAQLQGREVTTVEGIKEPAGPPHPLQTAFVEKGAVQCGYCTPGMLLSAKALLASNPSPSTEEVCRALDGNLCRCTGYQKIIEAVQLAAGRMRD